jgi:DNA-binding NtrC family response regulator
MADREAGPAREIWVIGDDEDMLIPLEGVLTDAGFTVTRARSGAEAQLAMGPKRPDLVMLDAELRDQDALALLTRIRQEHPGTGVLIMTAFGDRAATARALRAGAYDHVTKPFEREELLAALRRAFEHQDLAAEVGRRRMTGEGRFKAQVAALERSLILEALERSGGNRSRAAEELGIYRRLLYAKMRQFGLVDEPEAPETGGILTRSPLDTRSTRQ